MLQELTGSVCYAKTLRFGFSFCEEPYCNWGIGDVESGRITSCLSEGLSDRPECRMLSGSRHTI